MDFELSTRQKRIAATALTLLSLTVILAAVAGLVWGISLFLGRFSNVFLPLAVALVGALVVRPYFEFLRVKLKFPAPLALLALLLSVAVPIVAFVWFFGALIVDQVAELVEAFPAWWERVEAQFERRWPQVVEWFETDPWGQKLRESVESHEDTLFQGLQFVGGKALSAGAGIARGVSTLVGWAVMPVYLVFFLLAPSRPVDRLGGYLPFLTEKTRGDVVFLVQQFLDITVSFFRGQLVIAFLQGLLFAIGFSVVGLQFGFVLGLVLGLLNIIPYLGSMIGLGVTLPLAFFQQDGGVGTLAGVIIVFVLVQLIEGYLLTPKIMGDRTGLHPVAIIVAIFFWGTALSGILGMILAIPLTAFLVVFWRLARERYVDEWV